jgi:hypothetical protein
MVDYRMCRNKVQRSARNLRNKYYRRHIISWRDSNTKQWWQNIRNLTGQTATNYFIGIAIELCDRLIAA